MRQIVIGPNDAGQRFDKYLKKLFPKAQSGFLYKMLRKKNIVLNGKKATGSEKLNLTDEVKIFFSEETFEKLSDGVILKQNSDVQSTKDSYDKLSFEKSGLTILYEDEDLLAVNKPAGMLSQKAKADDFSANEWILLYLETEKNAEKTGKTKEIAKDSLVFRPSVMNRLDRNTSGILLAGKTLKGLQEGSKALKERTIKKEYLALVKGKVKKEGVVRSYLLKDEGKNQVQIFDMPREGTTQIETGFYVKESFGEQYTLLRIHLITGKTHQIRAQLAAMGHPIIGDPKYGDVTCNRLFRDCCKVKRQLLHAYRVILTDQTVIEAPLPKDFSDAISYAQKERNS